MIKRIKSISNYMLKDDGTGNTKQIPWIKIQLNNLILQYSGIEADTNLKFNGIDKYNQLFERTFSMGGFREAKIVKGILDKMYELEQADKPYMIIIGINCMVMLKSGMDETTYDFISPDLVKNFSDIVTWMQNQDDYWDLPEEQDESKVEVKIEDGIVSTSEEVAPSS